MSTGLEVRKRQAVHRLCAREAERRRLPVRAGTQVRDAFFAVTYPEVDRLAAKQAIAAALWRHVQGLSTAWRSKEHGDAFNNGRSDEVVETLAVIAALDDEPVASADATRDRDRALLEIQRCVGEQLAETVRQECEQLGHLLDDKLPWSKRPKVKKLWSGPSRLLRFLRRLPQQPEERVLDPDPWWLPGLSMADPPAPPWPEGLSADAKVALLASLLTAYTTQFGQYTTLLWQVPALSLTAQSFLLTLALTHGNGNIAKWVASPLSILIALASWRLMHDQRGHAMNHGELASRVSKELGLAQRFGTIDVDDAKPNGTDAETVWVGWDHGIYGAWQWATLSFLVADGVVLLSIFI